MALDYSKFDKLAKALENEEEMEKQKSRIESRMRYEKEQREKQIKWEEDMRKQGKNVEELKKKMTSHGCSHNHMNMNSNHVHSSDCDHSHDHKTESSSASLSSSAENQPQKSNTTKVGFPPAPSCGYMPVEEMQRISELRKKNPQPSTEDKNKKKLNAVYATREHGNQIFKEGNYEMAYKIYERGALIINGMYGLSDSEFDEMEKFEAKLDLNMALCKLKLHDWTEAISNCKMALQLDEENPKAYYRWAEALIGMGEYDKAKVQSLKAADLAPKDVGCRKQVQRIDTLIAKQMDKTKKNEKLLAKRLKQQT